KQACLHSLIGFPLQRICILPCDVCACWDPADRAGPVPFTLVAFGFVFSRIPGVKNGATGGTDGDAVWCSLLGDSHEPAPILGNDAHPIAGEVISCRSLSGLWRAGGSSPTAASLSARSALASSARRSRSGRCGALRE